MKSDLQRFLRWRSRHVRVDDLPLAVTFRPDVGEAQRDRKRLAAIRAAQVHQAAHHGAVAPHFLDRFQDFEGLDLVARRCVVGDELGLVLDAADGRPVLFTSV